MKLAKIAATIGVVGSLLSSTVATAAATRAVGALPVAHIAKAPQQARVSKQMDEQSQLLGAPLFLAFLGAVVIVIGTIIITNDDNSPG